MNEKIPLNPSEALHGSLIESAKQAEVEAYAAMPYMDIAVSIYDANMEMYARESGDVSEDDRKDIMFSDGMPELTQLAEREAANAGKKYEMFGTDYRPKLSEDETVFVAAMKVKAEHDNAQSKVDFDLFYNEAEQTNGKVLMDMVPQPQRSDSARERTRLLNLDQRLTANALDAGEYGERYSPRTSIIGLVGQEALAGANVAPKDTENLRLTVKLLEQEKELFDVIAQKYPVSNDAYENPTPQETSQAQ